MAVGVDFYAVEAGGLHALGGCGVVGDDAGDVPVFEGFGEGAMGGLADRGWGEDGQPVGLVPDSAAAEVGDLDHDRGAVRVAVVGQAAHPGDDLVLVGEQVAEDRGESGETTAEPAVIVRAMPPLAFSTW